MLIRSALLLVLIALTTAPAQGRQPSRESGEAQWIWTPTRGNSGEEKSDEGVSYFRKTFFIPQPVHGQIDITCQDRYELFVNGRRVGGNGNWRVLNRYDVRSFLVSGRNVIAVRAEKHRSKGRAGFVARVITRSAGGTFVSFSTDASWKCNRAEFPRWNWLQFNDARWTGARSLGEFGRTPPWDDLVRPKDGSAAGRFKLPPNFHVERIVGPKKCGSLVAMAFDEWGNIIVAQEGGPLLLIEDRDQDGDWETVVPFSDQVKSCQGILPINRDVYVVGEGPQGAGLYRLSDEDGDGMGETATVLLKFKGDMSEHGAHAPTLGPDGWIYLTIGNHAAAAVKPAKTSPYRRFYEGDLLQPRYEDAGGHAHGIKAPGGVIVRLTLDGKQVEYFCGGLRNAYDIAFNRDGELFTYDSDMEWDEGMPWYRPTRLLHAVPGAEFGWRSGWAKWPQYYLDSLPPLLETGRGSPTGLEMYDHTNFPAKYRGSLFICDWTLGRILAIKMRPAHGAYQAQSEVFLEGKPLNVTDVAVGPDGWLYFCTGGRGTEGGIYRIVYTGDLPASPRLAGIGRAIRQPQFYSAYARDAIASVQEEMGDAWDQQLAAVVEDEKAASGDRTRGMELMHLYGPYPSTTLLVKLSRDADFLVRAKAVALMAQHADDDTRERLVKMLADDHPTVRRRVCEALVRCRRQPPVENLLPLLADANRYVSWAARRLLEEIPIDRWQKAVLESKEPRVFNHGAVAALTVQGDKETAHAVLASSSRLIQGFLNDGDFIDLLRVIQLAMHRGGIAPDDVPAKLRRQLAEEYPAITTGGASGGRRINRELVRLLVYLQEPSLASGLMRQLRSDEPAAEKLHAALHARFLTRGWTSKQKYELLEYYEQARETEGGYSLSGYVDKIAHEFVGAFTLEERNEVLRRATRWPTSALGALMVMPPKPGDAMLAQLKELDQRLAEIKGEPARKLQTGIVAVLAGSGDGPSMAYLRDVFENQPSRRMTVAMGLAQSPAGKNWPLLIRSLAILDGEAAIEVLDRLKRVDGGPPQQAESVRQVILCGLRLNQRGAEHSVALLEYWFDQQLGEAEDDSETALQAWQKWFVQEFPHSPPPELPKASSENRWNYRELLARITDPETYGDPARGAIVFGKSQCIKCHRFGRVGEGIGPDLTTVSRRFQKREVLESVMFPSHVISDQYASKTVTTLGGKQFTGIVVDAGSGVLIVLQSNGKKVRIRKESVDEITPSKLSSMPEGLFNDLTLEEIVDLFEYLYHSPLHRLTRKPQPPRR